MGREDIGVGAIVTTLHARGKQAVQAVSVEASVTPDDALERLR